MSAVLLIVLGILFGIAFCVIALAAFLVRIGKRLMARRIDYPSEEVRNSIVGD